MLKSLLAIGLSLLLTVIPVSGTPTGDQTAGAVKALVPDASRNAKPVAVNDSLQWNDLLETNAKGRLRVSLTDGSILSLGSNSQLRVVQHDAASQQTALDLNYGKLRNQVTKITQPGGKYEVKTPNAVIGVIGTDFYVAYDLQSKRTTVICYQGMLSVTPGDDAKIVDSNNASTGAAGAVTVTAGHMVIIGSKIEGAATEGTEPYSTMAKSAKTNTLAHSPHPARLAIIIGMGVVAGLTVGLTQINSSSKPCGCK